MNQLQCPECGALSFTGSCTTCVEVRSIRFGKSWFQEAVDLSLKALRAPTEKAGNGGSVCPSDKAMANSEAATHPRGCQPSESVDLALQACKPRVEP